MTTVYIRRLAEHGEDPEVFDEGQLPHEMIINETHNERGLSGHFVLVSIFDGSRDYAEVADMRLAAGEWKDVTFDGVRYRVEHLS